MKEILELLVEISSNDALTTENLLMCHSHPNMTDAERDSIQVELSRIQESNAMRTDVLNKLRNI